MDNKSIALGVTTLVLSTSLSAASINISVSQDASINSGSPDETLNNTSWVYVETTFQSLFGFDMSSLTSQLSPGESLIINNLSFNAYNNFSSGTGSSVRIALDNNDSWDESTITWNTYAGHGASLDSIFMDASDVDSYISWDVSGINVSEILDNSYLTFSLYDTDPIGGNWHNFQPLENSGSNEAFLNVDYTIVSAVPVPAAVWLFGSGLIGLVGLARRKKA